MKEKIFLTFSASQFDYSLRMSIISVKTFLLRHQNNFFYYFLKFNFITIFYFLYVGAQITKVNIRWNCEHNDWNLGCTTGSLNKINVEYQVLNRKKKKNGGDEICGIVNVVLNWSDVKVVKGWGGKRETLTESRCKKRGNSFFGIQNGKPCFMAPLSR